MGKYTQKLILGEFGDDLGSTIIGVATAGDG